MIIKVDPVALSTPKSKNEKFKLSFLGLKVVQLARMTVEE